MKLRTPILFVLLLLLLGALVVFSWPWFTGEDLVTNGSERAPNPDADPSSGMREPPISPSRPATMPAPSGQQVCATLVTVRVLRADSHERCAGVHMTVMVSRDGSVSERRQAV